MTRLRNFFLLLFAIPLSYWGFWGETFLHSVAFALGVGVIIYTFIYLNAYCEEKLHWILQFVVGVIIEIVGTLGIFALILKLISTFGDGDIPGLIIIATTVIIVGSLQVTFRKREELERV